MKYVALLRGINVGGNNKISMSELKAACDHIGFTNVSTYINSGNIIFESNTTLESEITQQLEQAISSTFGLNIPVITVQEKRFLSVANNIPDTWHNDAATKCDVLFLWHEIDNAEILQTLAIKPLVDQVIYIPGAIVWAVEKAHIGKSGLLKIVGTSTYKKMTIRNCNTVRKISQLLQSE